MVFSMHPSARLRPQMLLSTSPPHVMQTPRWPEELLVSLAFINLALQDIAAKRRQPSSGEMFGHWPLLCVLTMGGA